MCEEAGSGTLEGAGINSDKARLLISVSGVLVSGSAEGGFSIFVFAVGAVSLAVVSDVFFRFFSGILLSVLG